MFRTESFDPQESAKSRSRTFSCLQSLMRSLRFSLSAPLCPGERGIIRPERFASLERTHVMSCLCRQVPIPILFHLPAGPLIDICPHCSQCDQSSLYSLCPKIIASFVSSFPWMAMSAPMLPRPAHVRNGLRSFCGRSAPSRSTHYASNTSFIVLALESNSVHWRGT